MAGRYSGRPREDGSSCRAARTVLESAGPSTASRDLQPRSRVMQTAYINHVAVPVDDVERATDFYRAWFGATVVPFDIPVSWVVLGDVQVHLVLRPRQASGAYHFAISIEDREQFEDLCRRARREDIFERGTFAHHLYEAAGGVVQLYVNDPSGNIVECDYPSVDDLDPEIAALRWRWADQSDQSEWNRRAPLFEHRTSADGSPVLREEGDR